MYYVSGVNRANFVRCRSKLNKEKRRARAKAIFEFEKGQRKSKLAKTKPKQFWKAVKKKINQNRNVSRISWQNIVQK